MVVGRDRYSKSKCLSWLVPNIYKILLNFHCYLVMFIMFNLFVMSYCQ